MMLRMRTHRLLIACVVLVLLAACGRSHVTRESGSQARNSTRTPAGASIQAASVKRCR